MKKTYQVTGWLTTVIAILTLIYRYCCGSKNDADDEESKHHDKETATEKFTRRYGKCFSRHRNKQS